MRSEPEEPAIRPGVNLASVGGNGVFINVNVFELSLKIQDTARIIALGQSNASAIGSAIFADTNAHDIPALSIKLFGCKPLRNPAVSCEILHQLKHVQ